MRACLILTPWAIGLGLFYNGFSPVWPWLLVSCAFTFYWNRYGAIVLACAVIILQFIKASELEHLWVYFGTTYAIIGFLSALFVDKVAAAAAFVIGAVFIFLPADWTEIAFYGGLIGAAYVGPSGGILADVLGPSKRPNVRRAVSRIG